MSNNKIRLAVTLLFTMFFANLYAYYPFPYPTFGRSNPSYSEQTKRYDAVTQGEAKAAILIAEIELGCWNSSNDHRLNVSKLNEICRGTSKYAPAYRGNAAYILALCYEVGLGVTRNISKANEYYNIASKSGEKRADAEMNRIKNYGYRSQSKDDQQIIISYFGKLHQRGNDYEPARENYPDRTPETKQVTCENCNGTGLIYVYSNLCVNYYNQCQTIYCRSCGRSHCFHVNHHENCIRCKGTGKYNKVIY